MTARKWVGFACLICVAVSLSAAIIGVKDAAFLGGHAASAAAITPTNLPSGASAYAWYDGSLSGYATNAGVVGWTNLTSIGSSLDMLNGEAASRFPVEQTAQLNGLDTLYFAGASGLSPYLAALWKTTVPTDVFMVLSITNAGATLTEILGSLLDSLSYRVTRGNPMFVYNGINLGSAAQITNRYIVLNAVFTTNGLSRIYTNNVSGVSGNSGTYHTNNYLTIGAFYNGNNGCRFSLAALFAYTNQILSASDRLAAYQYCTNRFALSP